MIFVTVGTHNQKFDRLIKEADKIAPLLNEGIFIQTGYTNYKPKNCRYKNFLSQKEFEKACQNASIIVTHGGVGSIMTPLLMGKKVVVVPRLERYNEHTDDHQLQITNELESQGKVIGVLNIENLLASIQKVKKMKAKKFGKNSGVVELVEKFIGEYENRNSVKQVP